MVTVCLGIDISYRSTGWAAGPSDRTPETGTWHYRDEGTGADLGLLLSLFERDLNALCARFAPTHVVYEAPLLVRFDKLATLRRTYSMGAFLEKWGRDRWIVVQEEDPKNLKRRLTGNAYAKKTEMVKVAKAMGVKLPPGGADGPAGDAADAYACWLVCVTHHARADVALWDQALYARRGKLL